MKFFQKIIRVLTNPQSFFAQIKKESFKETFWFFLILELIAGITSTFDNLRLYQLEAKWYPWAYLAGLSAAIILFFLFTGMAHLFLKLLKGQGKFSDTMKGAVYGGVPGTLWLILGMGLSALFYNRLIFQIVFWSLTIVTIVYSIILEVAGLSLLHKMSKWRAFLGAIALPLLVGIILFVTIFMLIAIFSFLYLIPIEVLG